MRQIFTTEDLLLALAKAWQSPAWECNTFPLWLPFTAWVRHRDQFAFTTHCFLEHVSNPCRVSQAPLTDTLHSSARLSCRAAPVLCQGMVLARSWHGLCSFRLLSLARLITANLPRFAVLMGKKIINNDARWSYHFIQSTKLPSSYNNIWGFAWVEWILVKSFIWISIQYNLSYCPNFYFIQL